MSNLSTEELLLFLVKDMNIEIDNKDQQITVQYKWRYTTTRFSIIIRDTLKECLLEILNRYLERKQKEFQGCLDRGKQIKDTYKYDINRNNKYKKENAEKIKTAMEFLNASTDSF
jgi:hypothetical protein